MTRSHRCQEADVKKFSLWGSASPFLKGARRTHNKAASRGFVHAVQEPLRLIIVKVVPLRRAGRRAMWNF
jgi:hypothetical protein